MKPSHTDDLKNLLIGKRFGLLTIIGLHGKTMSGNLLWSCECDCGNTTNRNRRTLTDSPNLSCGCYHKHNHGVVTHGMSGTRTHGAWTSMKQRCQNPKFKSYHNYGGRGIKVCERWLVFGNFFEDMGECPPRLELDREDNDGDYEPGNCRWATSKENNRNKRKTVFVEFRGESKPLVEVAEMMGICRNVLKNRTKSGWDIETAVSTPINKRRKL